MNSKLKIPSKSLATAGLMLAMNSAHAVIIISENFGGTGAALNGTTADTFDAGITGGSGTWVAAGNFADNGVISSNGSGGSAYLPLGSYINDARGTAAGEFNLTIVTSATTNTWASFGFSALAAPDTSENFVVNDGVATLLYRSSGELAGFRGLGSASGTGNSMALTGARTLNVNLDLTDWNGTTNFGTATYSDSVEGVIGTSTLNDDSDDFASLLISEANTSTATISSITLEQVPEPSSLALLGLGSLALLRRRRK